MTAVLSVDTVVLTAFGGASDNIALIDVTTDTAQAGSPTGLSGGVDYHPGSPEIPTQFSVMNDTDFNYQWELLP